MSYVVSTTLTLKRAHTWANSSTGHTSRYDLTAAQYF